MLENSMVVGADAENDKLFLPFTQGEIDARSDARMEFVAAMMFGGAWLSKGREWKLGDALESLHCATKGTQEAELWALLREHSEDENWDDIAQLFLDGQLPAHYRMFVQAAHRLADYVIGEELV